MAAKSRKLPMMKREDKKQLSVSFTKRRQGLFNKAVELFMLCDAQLALFVSSPSTNPKRKLYSFGHPSVDEVFDAFLERRLPNAVNYGYGANKQCALSLSSEIKAMEAQLNGKNKNLLNVDFEFFEKSNSVKELQALVDALQELKEKAKKRVKIINNSSVSPDNTSNMKSLLDDSHPTSITLTSNGYRPCTPSTRLDYANGVSSPSNIDTNDILPFQDTSFGYNYIDNSIIPFGCNGNNSLSVPQAASCSNYNEFKDSEAVCNMVTDFAPNLDGVNYNNLVGGKNNSWIDNSWRLNLLDVAAEHINNGFSLSDIDGTATLINNDHQMLLGGNDQYVDSSPIDDWLWS